MKSVWFIPLLLLMAAGVLAQSAGFLPSREFPKTDFDNRSVELNSILSGGPPRDGIPAIDAPVFATADKVVNWLGADEPVIAFTHGSDNRAYPLQILIYHEIVNDTVAGLPVTVTFCPLCNASIVFDRRVDGEVLDFGTTGRLRNSDLVMYDRQSESWWQQLTGRGIIGKYNGIELEQLDSQIVSFDTFRQHFPDGMILTRDTGFQRPYGNNPYSGYDNINSRPFLYGGEIDERLPPMERVLVIPARSSSSTASLLLPLGTLADLPLLAIEHDNLPIVILAQTEAQSALDKSRINESRNIPAAAAFLAQIDDTRLSFAVVDGKVVDKETGSEWNPFGIATAGKYKGQALKQIDRGVHFAFAWLAFEPGAIVR